LRRPSEAAVDKQMGRHDAVGDEVLTELLAAMAFRGRAVIVGAYDLRPFQASALTVLMGLQEIRSCVYRYFLEPPRAADIDYLCGVLDELADPSAVVPIAGLHRTGRLPRCAGANRRSPPGRQARTDHGLTCLVPSPDESGERHDPSMRRVARRHGGAIPPRHILPAPDSPA